jgi:hypothetical protein
VRAVVLSSLLKYFEVVTGSWQGGGDMENLYSSFKPDIVNIITILTHRVQGYTVIAIGRSYSILAEILHKQFKAGFPLLRVILLSPWENSFNHGRGDRRRSSHISVD